MTNQPITPAPRFNSAGSDARLAATRTMIPYIAATPADRSRNGRRIPRSVKHKGLR